MATTFQPSPNFLYLLDDKNVAYSPDGRGYFFYPDIQSAINEHGDMAVSVLSEELTRQVYGD